MEAKERRRGATAKPKNHCAWLLRIRAPPWAAKGGKATAAALDASRGRRWAEKPRLRKPIHSWPRRYTSAPRSRRHCRIADVGRVFIFLTARWWVHVSLLLLVRDARLHGPQQKFLS